MSSQEDDPIQVEQVVNLGPRVTERGGVIQSAEGFLRALSDVEIEEDSQSPIKATLDRMRQNDRPPAGGKQRNSHALSAFLIAKSDSE